jgi:hypothetical protein
LFLFLVAQGFELWAFRFLEKFIYVVVHYDEQKREKFPGGNRDMASVAGLGDEG